MAKVMVVGELFRKNSYCPQCRKRVPDENKRENGIKCPRCGFFRWEDYKKYPSFTSIPEPTEEEAKQASEFIARMDTEKGAKAIEEKLGVKTKTKGGGKRPVLTEEIKDESSVAARPQSSGGEDRRSREDKPISGASKSSPSKSADTKKPAGKKPTAGS